ncbi:unnamed protein product, partial [Ilex paraguariensis]
EKETISGWSSSHNSTANLTYITKQQHHQRAKHRQPTPSSSTANHCFQMPKNSSTTNHSNPEALNPSLGKTKTNNSGQS